MKTIFITASEPQMTRYFFRTGLFDLLTKTEQTRIVLIAPAREAERYEQEFGNAWVVIAGLPPLELPRAGRLLVALSETAFGAVFTRFSHRREHYRNGTSWLKVYAKRIIACALGKSHWLQAVVRRLAPMTNRDAAIRALFDEYAPDLVFATALINAYFDVPLLSEARRRGIKTAGSVRSWDNLSTYGFLLFHPDRMIVQNEYLREAARDLHFVPPERIAVTGFPHFDWYAHREYLRPRDEFCRSLGIDPAKRVILYGAAGDTRMLHDIETDFAVMFEDAVSSGRLPKDVMMIFRAHPLFKYPIERLRQFRFVIPDKVLGEGFQTVGDPETDRRDMIHLFNSLVHSDIVVVPAGTIAIEAIALDRPVITLAFDGTRHPPHWSSTARAYDTFDYWMAAMACSGMRKASSGEEFITALTEYLDDRSRDRAGRARVRARFSGELDGQATTRLAQELQQLWNRE